MNDFAAQLKPLLEALPLRKSQVAQFLEISPNTFEKWHKGKNEPNAITQAAILSKLSQLVSIQKGES